MEFGKKYFGKNSIEEGKSVDVHNRVQMPAQGRYVDIPLFVGKIRFFVISENGHRLLPL